MSAKNIKAKKKRPGVRRAAPNALKKAAHAEAKRGEIQVVPGKYVFLTHEALKAIVPWDEAALFSLAAENSEEEDQFRQSLDENGQRDPIVIVNGKIADGRRRVRAAIALGIGLWAIVRDDIEDGVLDFVLDVQFRRRETEKGERAMVVAHPKVRGHFQRQAKRRQSGGGVQPNTAGGSGQWTQVAGRVAKVGKTSIVDAVRVWDKGIPPLHALVLSGEVSVSAAAAVAMCKMEEEQIVLCEQGAEAVKRMARTLAKVRDLEHEHAKAQERAKPLRARLNLGTSTPLTDADQGDGDEREDVGDVIDGAEREAGNERDDNESDDDGDDDRPELEEGKHEDDQNGDDTDAENRPVIPGTTSPATDATPPREPADIVVARPTDENTKRDRLRFDAALRALFGREPTVCTDHDPAVLDGHDVVFADVVHAGALCEHILGKPRDTDLVFIAPLHVGTTAAQLLLSTKPTCIPAVDDVARPWLISYVGQRATAFAAAFTALGVVVVPAPMSGAIDDIIKLTGPHGAIVRALRDGDVVWVAPKDVAEAIGSTANAIDGGLERRLLKNGRDPDLKVVPARALAQRLRERPTLVGKLQGERREMWCAFLEGVGGAP